jgi:hypothetical protein
MQPIVVVLPAPFGPSKPNTWPGPAAKLMPSTATVSPYCLRSASTDIEEIGAPVRLYRACGGHDFGG